MTTGTFDVKNIRQIKAPVECSWPLVIDSTNRPNEPICRMMSLYVFWYNDHGEYSPDHATPFRGSYLCDTHAKEFFDYARSYHRPKVYGDGEAWYWQAAEIENWERLQVV